MKKARIPCAGCGPLCVPFGSAPQATPSRVEDVPVWGSNGHAAPLEHGVPRVSSASHDREEADHPLSDLNRRVLDPGASSLKRATAGTHAIVHRAGARGPLSPNQVSHAKALWFRALT